MAWLPIQVTNTTSEVNATNETQDIMFSAEEKRRLIAYLDMLIEMDQQ